MKVNKRTMFLCHAFSHLSHILKHMQGCTNQDYRPENTRLRNRHLSSLISRLSLEHHVKSNCKFLKSRPLRFSASGQNMKSPKELPLSKHRNLEFLKRQEKKNNKTFYSFGGSDFRKIFNKEDI